MKRLLIRYFSNKGYRENFDKKIYPPTIQDLPVAIPQLIGKIEIQPNVENIDPNTGVVKIGWNLFVNGTQRMNLGESSHANLAEIQNAVFGPSKSARYANYATPRRIVNYIVNVLSKSKSGDISSIPDQVKMSVLPLGTGDHSGYYRTQHRPVL